MGKKWFSENLYLNTRDVWSNLKDPRAHGFDLLTEEDAEEAIMLTNMNHVRHAEYPLLSRARTSRKYYTMQEKDTFVVVVLSVAFLLCLIVTLLASIIALTILT
jgi:hypothetical protein